MCRPSAPAAHTHTVREKGNFKRSAHAAFHTLPTPFSTHIKFFSADKIFPGRWSMTMGRFVFFFYFHSAPWPTKEISSRVDGWFICIAACESARVRCASLERWWKLMKLGASGRKKNIISDDFGFGPRWAFCFFCALPRHRSKELFCHANVKKYLGLCVSILLLLNCGEEWFLGKWISAWFTSLLTNRCVASMKFSSAAFWIPFSIIYKIYYEANFVLSTMISVFGKKLYIVLKIGDVLYFSPECVREVHFAPWQQIHMSVQLDILSDMRAAAALWTSNSKATKRRTHMRQERISEAEKSF